MTLRTVACVAALSLVGCAGQGVPNSPISTAPTSAPSLPPSVAPPSNEWPEGFATHYSLVFEMPFENEPYTEGGLTDAFLIRERVTLVVNGRTAGSGVLTGLDYRPGNEAVECDGESFVGEPNHDLADPPSGFEGEFKDGTKISLDADREIAVYVGNSTPTCFEHHGTYTVTFGGEGSPTVKSGRYAWVNASLDFDP